MQSIKLNLKKHSYEIVVGSNIINFLGRYIAKLDIGTDAYVITNASIKNIYGTILHKILRRYGFNANFKIVPDSEKSKSIKTVTSVVKDIVNYDKRRQIFIIAFGGGVIGDLAGFIASIYKRGVPYIQVPTTLLAQVDSSIGGKTAVDLAQGKNLVGAFYQPRLVFSDVKFLDTLNQRQIRSGLSEIIKYAIIQDRKFFLYLEKRQSEIFALKPTVLEHIVKRCSQIKAKIVQNDEREERGLRTVLNFGHTIGHAIEAAANYKAYNHGEALALGMLIASDISRSLNLIDNAVFLRIEGLIKAVGLPSIIRKVSLRDVIEAYYRDKKFIGRKNRLVLIRGIGKTKIVENVPLEIIREAIKKRI